MPLEVSFVLSDQDLDYFRSVMGKAQQDAALVSEKEIIEKARTLLKSIDQSKAQPFITQRLEKLDLLIGMLGDPEWPISDQERVDVISALAYFYHAEDLIADNVPVLGLIDDAIMIELVVRELKHEFDAYSEFCEFRDKEEKLRAKDISREDWLKVKQIELVARMRDRVNRRNRSSSGVGRLTRFSFLG